MAATVCLTSLPGVAQEEWAEPFWQESLQSLWGRTSFLRRCDAASQLPERPAVAEVFPAIETAMLQYADEYTSENYLAAHCLAHIAAFAFRNAAYAQAADIGRDAVEMTERVFGPSHETLAKYLGNLFVYQLSNRQVDDAFRSAERAAEITRAISGENSPAYGIRLHHMARAAIELDHFAEAEVLMDRSIDILLETVGPDTPQLGHRLRTLSSAISAQGRLVEAITILDWADEVYRSTGSHRSLSYAYLLESRAKLAMQQGNHAEAEAMLTDALSIAGSAIGTDGSIYAAVLATLGRSVMAQHRYIEAEAMLWEAAELTRTALGETSYQYGLRLADVSVNFSRQGMHEQARTVLRRALDVLLLYHDAADPDLDWVYDYLEESGISDG